MLLWTRSSRALVLGFFTLVVAVVFVAPIATVVAAALAGSWTDRGARHGANAADMALSSPEQRTVCRSRTPPAEETNCSRVPSTTTAPPGLRFTYGVPFLLANLDP